MPSSTPVDLLFRPLRRHLASDCAHGAEIRLIQRSAPHPAEGRLHCRHDDQPPLLPGPLPARRFPAHRRRHL